MTIRSMIATCGAIVAVATGAALGHDEVGTHEVGCMQISEIPLAVRKSNEVHAKGGEIEEVEDSLFDSDDDHSGNDRDDDDEGHPDDE